ncbi:MAG: ABC transporter ATP-binding protein [Bdellovibrionales bacterium]|nr:ABC transporter ATP-binding protein [Bdellovibrionales bacterium]
MFVGRKKILREKLSEVEQIGHYTAQPAALPAALKILVEEQTHGEPMVAYAMVDLDERFRLTERWLGLTKSWLVTATPTEIGWKVQTIERSRVSRVCEVSGLSCNRLYLEGERGEGLLCTVRYTHRQSRLVGVIKTLLELELEANEGIEAEVARGKTAEEIYSENLLSAIKEAQASVASHQLAVVWRLLSYLKPYKIQVTLGLLGAALMTLVSLVPAYLTGLMLDQVIKPFGAGRLSLAEAKQMVGILVVGLAATLVLREFFAWIRLRTMSVIGEYVAKDLRDEVYSHLHRLSLSFFSSRQTGSLISRVGSDTDRIWDFIAFGVVEVSTSLLLLAGLAGVLIFLDWPLGLLVTIPVPLILWSILKHGEQMQNLFLRAWRKWSQLTACLSDTIPGVRVVKAFNQERAEVAKFVHRNDQVLGEFSRIHETWTRFWPKLMLTIHGIQVAVWIFGVPRVLQHIEGVKLGVENPGGLTPGVFVSFVLYMTMFVQPIEVIGQMARMINRATSSAQRVFEVLDTEPQILDRQSGTQHAELVGRVEFRDVTFSYDGVRKVLKNVNLTVEPGEMVGLVGSSGSGKSTLINLLARFYDLDQGAILVDGIDIRELDMGCYRTQLGMVLQDPYLFHGSILDNIRYACPEAAPGEVIEAARVANAHDFICQLTHGYDTIVGERGHTLSGGERQRISIARAVLRNPRVLILDEATSAVDSETERKIQQALDRLIKGRTVIAIAHRLSTLASASRLLVLKDGRIVERGSHAELMGDPQGIYRRLVDLQQQLHLGCEIA